MLAFPCGRFGVLSPLKNGSTKTPSHPGLDFSASASNSFTSRFKSVLISSEATVQFIVQRSGKYPPEEEQNPEMPSAGSATEESVKPYKVPEVPMLIVSVPLFTAPVPIALIMLSPPPEETAAPFGIPSQSAAFFETNPEGSSLAIILGSFFKSDSSIASQIFFDHFFSFELNKAVPEASPCSIT